MRPEFVVSIRFLRCFAVATLLALIFNCEVVRAQAKTSATPGNPKIRAITAFINLDRPRYQQDVADALKMLRRAQTTFESRGYQVQTIRIATQPFPEYTKGLTKEQAVAFFKDYDALAVKENFAASIGPAMLHSGDSESQADLLGEILSNTKKLNGSVVVAGEDGVRWNAVGAAARVMKKLEETTEHSQGNFRFAAIAMVPPLTPFFPAAYHTGFGHQFAIALESANLVAAAFKDSRDLGMARQRLIDSLAAIAFDVEGHAGRVDQETGWTYMGIDLSPAPSGDVSIGAAIENLTRQPVGMSGTLTAAATIASAVKDVKVKQTGYTGLMLPILEDTRLAQRWSEGHISIDALLSYSAVCGTGLDTVPLPGDVSAEHLSLIIGDMASLAVKWHKPLSARLLPVLGKGWGEMTEFNDPFLVNAKLQSLDVK
ncbi:MAG: hypothetical protein AUH11_18500 [Acidobacteria bacterium 13_2_20CM_57_17]|nr:MAG: hypothetical protein AUH11_18500 [Acidobacteria bacterium 13_2_20CM_57_17]OLB94263.1 MAG: hypothetical protein AUI02_05515 [Acidobacteria bacterium 13_2_20CM_2_57_12]OLE14995.1 MAG: hypothetical protein AUG83_08785 [Acidobacteria bacterium 13_1_20CM_4_57_11]